MVFRCTVPAAFSRNPGEHGKETVHLQGYDPVPTGGTAAASQYGILSDGNAAVIRALNDPSGDSATISFAWR